MIIISDNNQYFLKDGKPYFLKLDTAWMAFTNLTLEEFEEYISFRSKQGYNGVLLQNTPALQDMTTHVKYQPFPQNLDGSFDFSRTNSEYFNMAVKKMEILENYGFTAFIVPMWVSFIPDSQMIELFDTRGKLFEDFELYKKFINFTINTYKGFHPVWLLGGDAILDDKNPTNFKYYSYMAEQIRIKCPEDLISAHVAGGSYIDKEYIDKNYIDFYTYQSGHMYREHSDLMSPVLLAQKYLTEYPIKPILNLEPMYEAHGYGNQFLRFDRYFLRRAFWYSVLSGANSGFAYGAHGIWMFYDGSGFTSESWSKLPLLWRNSLNLPGSYDVITSCKIFEEYNMFCLAPDQNINITGYEEIRTASSKDRDLIVSYTPVTQHIDFSIDLSEYRCRWYVLGENLVKDASVHVTVDCSVVDMYQCNSDAILICQKLGR